MIKILRASAQHNQISDDAPASVLASAEEQDRVRWMHWVRCVVRAVAEHDSRFEIRWP